MELTGLYKTLKTFWKGCQHSFTVASFSLSSLHYSRGEIAT